MPRRFFYLFLAVLTGCLLFSSCSKENEYVRGMVTVEAGSDMPDAKEFLLENSDKSVSYSPSRVDLSVTGDTSVTVFFDGKSYPSVLRVTDTVAPTAHPSYVTLMQGETAAAERFVTDISDETAVTSVFLKTPDWNATGEQSVTILLRDMGGNQTSTVSTLLILGISPVVSVEASPDTHPPDATDFLTHPDTPPDATDFLTHPDMPPDAAFDMLPSDLSTPPGEQPIHILVNGVDSPSALSLTDTAPPTPVNQEVWPGDKPADTEPPVISGVHNMSVFIGDKVTYRSGVSAADNLDGEVTVSVDSSTVNLNEEGTYEITYSATDSCGNKAVKTATITVRALTEALVNELADNILSQIVTNNMNLHDKAKAIYTWVKRNVKYTGSSAKDDIIKIAYIGFKNKQGDCYTYYAVSEFLLTQAGIPNMRVTRTGGLIRHFWNLVDVGSGWYHFDTCPTPADLDTFLFTSVQAAEYTEKIGGGRSYYTYDKTLYPRINGDPEKAVQ